jgi:putative ABC transport system ATP-binding protein
LINVNDLLFHYPQGGFHLQVPLLSIQPAEKVALIGPSGTGKTTLINLLAGILLPESGRIEIDGMDITTLPVEDRQDFRLVKMGLIFQEFGLLDYLSVTENICLPYRISPVLQMDDAVLSRAEGLAVDTGLGDRRLRYPAQLSQGERQRIEVCRALVTQPAMILADEPTGNLDPDNRDQVMTQLFSYANQADAPLVVITHDHELLPLFDRSIDIQDLVS